MGVPSKKDWRVAGVDVSQLEEVGYQCPHCEGNCFIYAQVHHPYCESTEGLPAKPKPRGCARQCPITVQDPCPVCTDFSKTPFAGDDGEVIPDPDCYYPHIEVQLTGEDGNVYHLIGLVSRALRREMHTQEEIEEFLNACTSTASYREALAVMTKWVTVL